MTHGKHYSPITLKREGEKFKNIYRIKQDVYDTDVNATAFNLAHNIDGIIRVPNELYASIDSSQSRYTHFNLEFSGHRIGHTYALPRVLRHGFFRSEGDEEPPVLSFDDI